ncbi:MAG: hypothetical protein IPK97_18140 [Ahniella sp.]|nr:hypothetical protein [Ahniella sp.]
MDGEYGDINGDGSPEPAIGRLPAAHVAELASMIAKILQPLPANLNTLVFVSERANAAEGNQLCAADGSPDRDARSGLAERERLASGSTTIRPRPQAPRWPART